MQDLVVIRRVLQGQNIAVLTLAQADGGMLPAFTAGAHIDLALGEGLTRQYSLCSDPNERFHYQIAVLREAQSRGGSAAVHALCEGDNLRVGAPRNLFALREDSAFTLLIAGGIGITPILAMAKALHAQGRAFALHYRGRSRAQMAFLEELAAAPFAAQVFLHISDEAGFDPARDLGPARAGTQVCFCGPAGFMDYIESQCLALGYAKSQLTKEHFSADVDLTGGGFTVTLARRGVSVQVAQDQTIVQALGKIGVRVETMCGEGICGTCLCGVKAGQPDHRDSFLTDEERAANDQMTLCCSRALTSELVLDL